MNKVELIGRLTRDPDIRYSQGEDQKMIARYTIAIDRPVAKEGQKQADFISCVAFGKRAEFAEKWLTKGMKIAVIGRIQTGSYTNKEGTKIYTTDVLVEENEFVESKGAARSESSGYSKDDIDIDGFMNIPDGIDEELPFQ